MYLPILNQRIAEAFGQMGVHVGDTTEKLVWGPFPFTWRPASESFGARIKSCRHRTEPGQERPVDPGGEGSLKLALPDWPGSPWIPGDQEVAEQVGYIIRPAWG